MTYTPEQKLAWQRQRIAEHVAKGQLAPTENIKRFLAGKPMLPNRPSTGLNKTIDVKVTAGSNVVQPKRSREKTIVADQASTCFDDLRWKNGTAFATFAKDGSQYEYEISRQQFLEWIADESLGGFFNFEVR
jgi:hypothetical protein